MKLPLRLLLFALAPVAAFAAPLTRDLGQGLAYHRIHTLPADLPGPETSHPMTRVIDLRYLQADADAAVALLAWVKFHAAPRTPVIVLANAATHPSLLAPLAGRGGGRSVLVLGVPGAAFMPDIAIQSTAEQERLAYDAFESGVEISALLAENTAKPRHDEASLSRDPSTEADRPIAGEKSPGEAPPLDAALQRAVHLHRALRALKKI